VTQTTLFRSTREVAELLGIRPDRLSHAVWDKRVPEPGRTPRGDFLWTEADINRASKALLGKPWSETKEPDAAER
jgi:hypothetical protein